VNLDTADRAASVVGAVVALAGMVLATYKPWHLAVPTGCAPTESAPSPRAAASRATPWEPAVEQPERPRTLGLPRAPLVGASRQPVTERWPRVRT
jgi:hypothetical protein